MMFPVLPSGFGFRDGPLPGDHWFGSISATLGRFSRAVTFNSRPSKDKAEEDHDPEMSGSDPELLVGSTSSMKATVRERRKQNLSSIGILWITGK